MELSISNEQHSLRFRFENTKHKLGVRICGNRLSFYKLHELLEECWECEDIDMSPAEACSYIGVISYFSYEVRHAFMGCRLVKFDSKLVKPWSDDIFQILGQEQEHIVVGMEFSWPQILCIMAAWWECLRHDDCPARVVGIIREFTDNIEYLLRQRSKTQYHKIEPYLHGAIYAANPYLMLTMEHINEAYLRWSIFGRASLNTLVDEMECAVYGTYLYEDLMSTLKKHAKKLGCKIEELNEQVDESVYDIEL